MDTWISSDDNVETVNVRDEGAESEDSTEALDTLLQRIADFKDASTLPDVATARQALFAAAARPLGQPARKAWPKGNHCVCRAYPSGEDTANFTLWGQLSHDWRVSTQGEEAAKLLKEFDVKVAVVAVMTVRLVGKLFIDKTTGEPLAITGKPLERMAAIRKLPTAVTNYVFDALNERWGESPLG